MGATVMVVDDSGSMRALLRLALAQVGYAVVEARDGREALDALGVAPADVIVSDCIMPVMDGLSFLRALKQDAALQRIPIIMLTTECQSAQIQQGRELGVQAWIVKPFQAAQLVEAVGRVLAGEATPPRA
jgi:two-component system chemotaxis response regulator CheY